MYYTTRVPFVVSRQFEDEIILANLETGIYYSLTGAAADIWLGIQCGATPADIAEAFATSGANGGEDTRPIVERFVDQLLAEKVVLPHGGGLPPERQPWAPQFGNPFSEPLLERFDDLRELLLLDPVHDVTDAGWPKQA
jgi:Coenzyme PQQ synthesis protein D (PqqD)